MPALLTLDDVRKAWDARDPRLIRLLEQLVQQPPRCRCRGAHASPADHEGRFVETAARMQPVGCEQVVEELNRDRSLADC